MWRIIEGIPVDLLVDIDGPYDCFSSHSDKIHSKIDLVSSDPNDDPFEMCSFSKQINNDDIGLELGLALEKSIKLCSQTNWQNNKSGDYFFRLHLHLIIHVTS